MELKKKYPKVLIIGEVFKLNSGGGITMSNLFADWPSGNLSVLSERTQEANGKVCENYYHLGKSEIRFKFPLSVFNPLSNSGSKHIIFNNSNSTTHINNKNHILKNAIKPVYYFSRNVIIEFLHRIGLYHSLYSICLSNELKNYVDTFNPDLLYCQIFSFNTIRLINLLKNYTNCPVVIHIMDDFPNIIIKRGLKYHYWHQKLDTEFKNIIAKSAVCLSISVRMSEEYKKRYSREFIPFRNPVDLSFWKTDLKKNYQFKDKFVILYAGRLGAGIDKTLKMIAASIDRLVIKSGYNIELLIQTTQFPKWEKEFEQTKFSLYIDYEKLPALFSSVDLLLLPYDFSGRGLIYIKYSMPTKVSEYMASSTPILIVSPKDTALYSYAKSLECAHIVHENNIKSIMNGIKVLYQNVELRRKYAIKALEIVKTDSEVSIVRENFLAALKSALG
ncbi:MAG: glycosyltransferase [Paludibacter sp.]|nr:glycosyltransferase [Paludibacter sp.]